MAPQGYLDLVDSQDRGASDADPCTDKFANRLVCGRPGDFIGAAAMTGVVATSGSPGMLDRPAPGTMLADKIGLYHDAAESKHTVHVSDQQAISIEIGRFDGSYLSLAVAADDIAQLVRKRHVTLLIDAVASRPITVLLRLYLAGPNDRKDLHDAVVLTEGERRIEFDLLALDLERLAIQDAWADVIFSQPAECRIDISKIRLAATPEEAVR